MRVPRRETASTDPDRRPQQHELELPGPLVVSHPAGHDGGGGASADELPREHPPPGRASRTTGVIPTRSAYFLRWPAAQRGAGCPFSRGSIESIPSETVVGGASSLPSFLGNSLALASNQSFQAT